MRCLRVGIVPGIAACFFLSISAFAGKVNSAAFPLRVHIVFRNGIQHYQHMGGGFSNLDTVDGLGKGDLFENGQPLGFDFNYECGQPITPESAFETFMARWKKQGRVLEILMPKMGGNPGDMNSCQLKVLMKQDTVYLRRIGAVVEEPAAQYKQWMIEHQYDPEHNKNEPVNLRSPHQAADAAPSN